MTFDTRKCPFPWFGGKADAAELVWEALGDCEHYVEPFAGSLAVLLRRPHSCNRTYYSETVADIDSLLCNFWRAVQLKPDEVAEAASWPVSELDKHARGCHVLKWRDTEATARLAGDPFYCEPLIAGWWAWCVCASIGAWGLGGPWWPDADGVLRDRGPTRGREPGVSGDLPHLGNNGRGVNTAAMREPGVCGNRPHLGNNGVGVNHASMREPGVSGEPDEPMQFHPLVMPRFREWLAFLQARLRHVRIVNGDWSAAINGSWKRVCTSGAAKTLPVRMKADAVCGIFLDPPYGDVGRESLYGAQESFTVAQQVRAWCLANGHDPDYRIVYAGYDEEGVELVADGWREVEWYRAGHLKGGMGNTSKTGTHQQHRERLWLSPHCLTKSDVEAETQGMLF